MNRLITLITLFSTVFMHGCASKTSDFKSPIPSYNHQDVTLKANIDEKSDGWTFTGISEKDQSREVRLDTFEYIGPTDPEHLQKGNNFELGVGDKSSGCVAGLYGLTDGTCNSRKFTGASLNPGFYAGSLLSTPFMQAMMIIYSPVLLVEGGLDVVVLPLVANREFNWDDYANAVEEAKGKDNFSERFPDAYNQYVSLKKDIAKYNVPEIPESNSDEVKAHIETLWKSKKSELLSEADKSVELVITDESGLGSEATESLEANDLLNDQSFSINPKNFLSRVQKKDPTQFGLKRAPSFRKGPFQNISELESYIEKKREKTENIKSYNKKNLESASEKREQENRKNQGVVETLRSELETATLSQKYEPLRKAEYSKLEDFNFEYDIPKKTIIASSGEHSGTDIELKIQSVDIKHYFSPSVEKRTDFINVRLENENLIVRNTSDRYVTINSISFYYRDKVFTRRQSGSQGIFELAPSTEDKKSIADAVDLEEINTEHPEMTVGKARNTNITYGISMRYTVSGQSSDSTLKKVKTFPLDDLIREEMDLL